MLPTIMSSSVTYNATVTDLESSVLESVVASLDRLTGPNGQGMFVEVTSLQGIQHDFDADDGYDNIIICRILGKNVVNGHPAVLGVVTMSSVGISADAVDSDLVAALKEAISLALSVRDDITMKLFRAEDIEGEA